MINVKELGAVGDGISDDSDVFLFAIEQCFKLNLNLYVPSGNYAISKNIILDRNRLGNARPSIIGEGSGISRISFKGQGDLITVLGDTKNPEGFHSFQKIEGIYFTAQGKEGQNCIKLMNCAFPRLVDVRIVGYDLAVRLEDVEHVHFESLNIRFCKKGILATTGDITTEISTHPNNITMQSCHVASCKEYGMHFKGGSTLNIIGGSIENNGAANPNGFGLLVENAGFQGGVACNLIGVYIESNSGVADLWFKNTNWLSPVITDSVYSVVGCTFNRTRAEWFSQNNIRCTFALPEQAGMQKLSLMNSSFKHYNNYIPDSSRKYIAYDGVPMSSQNFEKFGNLFKTVIEQ